MIEIDKYERTLIEHLLKRCKGGQKPVSEDYIFVCLPPHARGSEAKKALKRLVNKDWFLKDKVKNQFVYRINPQCIEKIKKEIL